MSQHQLAPDISILIEESSYAALSKKVEAAQETIFKARNIISDQQNKLEAVFDKVARKLVENSVAASKLDEVTINDTDFTLENYNDCKIKFTYSYLEPDSHVTVYDYDSYDDFEREIVSFPLSFVYRADWLAHLEVWVEADALKAERKEQEVEEQIKKQELETLRKLTEKYKGMI